jgi:hypothetical protein
VARKDDNLRRLRDEPLFWAKHCAKIVTKGAQLAPLEPRPAQLKVREAIARQQAAGRPVRIIVLKSRRTGISTWVQAEILHRCTTLPFRRALVVAHDKRTAGELFGIGKRIYDYLPDEVKPPLEKLADSTNGEKLMHYGGLDSRIRIDTAREVEAGRGLTLTDLHLSEAAFYPDPRKATALMSAVADEPGTLVVIESTAKGLNLFKEDWDRATRGESTYEPVFVSWLEDPDCWLPFPDEGAKEEFMAMVGTGIFGEDEPGLISRGALPEQLHWRRRIGIPEKARGKVDDFRQEYPSTPEEAFIGSGNHVFSLAYMNAAMRDAEQAPAPQLAVLTATATKVRKLLDGEVEVPTAVTSVPKAATGFPETHHFWEIWTPPAPDGQYLVAVDPAGDVETTEESQNAFNAVQVIDHSTGEQVAQWEARTNHDLVAMEIFKAGLFYNEAWVSVEVTGGYGIAIAVTLLWKRLGYRRLYSRPRVETRQQTQTKDRLGFSTDRRTKPMMEAGFAELLREGHHGIRSPRLAGQLFTYVKDEKNETRHGPEPGSHSDLLLAYMQAQMLRQLIPLRPRPGGGGYRPNSMTRRF